MKKRIIAIFLLVAVLVSCFGVVATATTKRGVLHKHDKWEYKTQILAGNYKSTYKDCTSWSCFDTIHLIGRYSHATMVTNNEYGTSSGKVYATHGSNAVATVKANWFGKDGTARIWYTGRALK